MDFEIKVGYRVASKLCFKPLDSRTCVLHLGRVSGLQIPDTLQSQAKTWRLESVDRDKMCSLALDQSRMQHRSPVLKRRIRM